MENGNNNNFDLSPDNETNDTVLAGGRSVHCKGFTSGFGKDHPANQLAMEASPVTTVSGRWKICENYRKFSVN